MSSIKSLNIRSLGAKLTAILFIVLAVLLVATLVILDVTMTNLTLRTGQQGVREETAVMISRFQEAEQDLATTTKLLATAPGLKDAIVIQDVNALRTILLTNASSLDVQDLALVNADGDYFETGTSKITDPNAQNSLLPLALLGIETTGIVPYGDPDHHTFLLASVVPLRDTSGTIVGALQAGYEINDEFLNNINFSRDNVQLAVFHDGHIAAHTISPDGEDHLDHIDENSASQLTDSNFALVFDEIALEQALNGEIVISPELISLDDEPYALAYMPLTVSGKTETILAVLFKVGQLFAFQQELSTNTIAIFVSLTLIALIFIALFVWKAVTAPIGKLTINAERITAGDYSQPIEIKTNDEIGQLALAFNEMTDALQKTIEAEQQYRKEAEIATEAMGVQVWQTTGQSQLNEKMQGVQDLTSLADKVVYQLCQYVQAEIGALYLAEEDELNLVGSYACEGDTAVTHFKVGEGIVGQVAKEKQAKFLTDVPPDHLIVRSGFSKSTPNNIAIFPFTYEDRVIGVIELGTLAEFDDTQLEFIYKVLPNIAIAFNVTQARERIDELLLQSQSQAEELQAQSEELRVANEELEAQTESLRTSETQLRENQQELEATNIQLEEKAAALEESSTNLREKQDALDEQNRILKEAQSALEVKAEELALASKYKSEFLANMSHELRTPLNSLLILARILAENEENNLTKEQVEAAQIIFNGGNDLLNLINDILDLSKVESGKMTFTIEPMAIVDLISAIRNQFNRVAEEKGLQFNVDLEADVPKIIKTDQQRMIQIVRNLLSNAFKFTSAGSVSLTISLPHEDVDLSSYGLDATEMIAFQIADTGIGMTPEQLKIIFEAFQQADGSTSREYGGTGLGLSISRELTAKLGGQIVVESERGVGSTFTLYLPVESKEVVEEGTAVSQTKPQSTPQNPPPSNGSVPKYKATKSIYTPPQPLPDDDRACIEDDDKIFLIIEDDPNFAKVLYNHAHKKGFKCLIAGTGTSGLNLLKNHTPDAVILDLNLPDMVGWEVLDQIKNNPQTRHIPVHIASVEDEVIDAYRRGAMGYLTKPVSKESLEKSFQNIEKLIAKDIKSLLLVEDDYAARIGITRLLEGSDVKITEAETGAAAFEKIKAERFDCIILDLTLPDMSGFELLSQLNKNEFATKCPIIVNTGRELSPEENHELMKYADSVIVKGVKSPERLLDETALFLHRVVADMPEDKQKTIKQLHSLDGILEDRHILIVDDDMRNSFALSKLLSDRGVIVKIAANGEDALTLLNRETVDLVLMDIMMPGIDGYEAIRRIRQQPQFSNLPILALTAKAMKGDKEKCLAAGANDYLSKPIDIDRLFSMLRVWLYQ